jgi:hypothetical protein
MLRIANSQSALIVVSLGCHLIDQISRMAAGVMYHDMLDRAMAKYCLADTSDVGKETWYQ